MRPKILGLALGFSLLAGACTAERTDEAKSDSTADNPDISINVDGEDGKVAIQSGTGEDEGKISLKTPMFDLKVDMGNLDLDASDIDLDGVDMYPGTKLTSFNVDAKEQANGDKAIVTIAMTYPAAAATVADWYVEQLDGRNVRYTRNGETISGRTGDGDRFTLAIADKGARSEGELTIRESK